MDVKRLLPLSGIVFVVVLVVAVVVLAGDHPESDGSAAAVSAFYADQVGRQIIAAFVLAAAAPFVVFFASSRSLAGMGGNRPRHRPVYPLCRRRRPDRHPALDHSRLG